MLRCLQVTAVQERELRSKVVEVTSVFRVLELLLAAGLSEDRVVAVDLAVSLAGWRWH